MNTTNDEAIQLMDRTLVNDVLHTLEQLANYSGILVEEIDTEFNGVYSRLQNKLSQ